MSQPQVITKTALMQLVISGRCRECFEHDPLGLFDITRLREAIRGFEIEFKTQAVTLDQICPFVRENRVTEPQRIDDLEPDSWGSDPGILVCMPDGSVMMIDGHHRALRREKEGLDTMLFHFVALAAVPRPSTNWVKNPNVTWGEDLEDLKKRVKP